LENDIGFGTAAGNPPAQEQPPVEMWGTNVVSMIFAGRTNVNSYRVLANSRFVWLGQPDLPPPSPKERRVDEKVNHY
jgi:hypothetical protein